MAITQLNFIKGKFTKLRDTFIQAIGYTPENISNKKQDLTDNSAIYYPSQAAIQTALDVLDAAKQDVLFYDTDLNCFVIDNTEYES